MLSGFLGRKVATQCATCRFWQPDEEQDDAVLGECRRAARESSRRAADPVESVHGLVLHRAWPVTESRDWCASWRESRFSHVGVPAYLPAGAAIIESIRPQPDPFLSCERECA